MEKLALNEWAVVLVNPARPENIGFICRAMKTNGFDRLFIVGKEIDLFETNARKTAYAAHDVLEKVVWFDSMKEAAGRFDMLVGTTAKSRTVRKDTLNVDKVGELLTDKGDSISSAALVFGSEESGLSAADLAYCDVVSTIPLATSYPSLNLSQAVLIYLYEASKWRKPKGKTGKKAEKGVYLKLKLELMNLLDEVNAKRNPVFYQRIVDRLALIKDADARLILTLIKMWRNKNTEM